MVVVLAIVSIIALISAAVLINARDDAVPRDAAEQFKADIRRIQNSAISTQGNCASPTDKPKMWGITFDYSDPANTFYQMYKFCPSAWEQAGDNVSLGTSNISVSAKDEKTGNDITNFASFVFSSPFDKYYFANSDLQYYSGAQSDQQDGSYCAAPTDTTTCNSLTASPDIIVTFSYKNKTSTVTINGKTGAAE